MQPIVALSILALNSVTVAGGLLLAAGVVLVAVHLARRRRQEDPNVWWRSSGPSRSPAQPVAGADGLVPLDDRPTGLRVLVVEDHVDMLQLCRQTLADDGYDVVTASSAEEALELTDDIDELHLVVTDIVMPGMDGMQMAAVLADRFPRMGVLLVSGHDPASIASTIDTSGWPGAASRTSGRTVGTGAGFLAKPFDPGQLSAAAADLTGDRRDLDLDAGQVARSYGRWTSSYGYARSGDASQDGDGRGGPDDAPRAVASGAASRVLIVEDDDSVRASCEQSLADEGYEVVTAASGREALELVATLDGLDLLVSDLNSSSLRDPAPDIVLPGTDRVTLDELLAACRRHNLQHDGEGSPGSTDRKSGSVIVLDPPVEDEIARNDAGGRPATRDAGIGVLLMSGHDPADVGIDPDEIAFLAKPFTPEQLLGAVRAAVTDTGNLRKRPGRTTYSNIVLERMSRAALVGFGTFTASKNRLAAVTATAGVAILIAGGIALAVATTEQAGTEDTSAVATTDRGDGTPEDPAADSPPAAAASPSTEPPADDADLEPTSGTTGSSPEPSRQLAAEPDPQTTLDVDPHPEQQASSEPQPGQEPSPDPSSEPSPDPSPESTPESSTEPEPAVLYGEPSKDAPELTSCSSQDQTDGTTTYTVQFTVQFSGGHYDVLPHEPFVNNDETVEVRNGTLTWNVTATHVGQRGDGDTFEVTAPSEFGWADPGSADRSHTHLPPALTVYTDQCRP